jgi:hypothetical protein
MKISFTFVTGGFDGKGEVVNNTQCYDIKTEEWSQLKPLPVPLTYIRAFASPGGIGICIWLFATQ